MQREADPAPSPEERDDERYRQLVELAPDAILVHDGSVILLANAAAVRLAGMDSAAELVGLPIDRFIQPPYLKSVEEQLTGIGVLVDPAPVVRDTFRRSDGADLSVEVRATPLIDRGHLAAHLVIRDISHRLRAEQSARDHDGRQHQAERMEAVALLAGGVAHEINNMMGVVLGCGHFLAADSRIPEERLVDVHEILHAANRAAAVTGQLLSFSRRAFHYPRAFDLGALVREAAPAMRLLLGERQHLSLMTTTHPGVFADPDQLKQVLMNLVLNARDAMPDGGTLTIRTGEILVTPEDRPADLPEGMAPGRYATLVASDTGVGMSAEVQAHVFEPFFTTKPLGHGSGLGLAAVLGTVAQNGGHVTVASVPGHGARFTLYLPLVAPPAGSVGDGLLHEGHAGATVLVVDDEPALRKIIARTLERAGFRVLQASNGAEALAMIEEAGPPRLVLTDLMMPEMSGAELLRRLVERWPGLPVVFMSGYAADQLLRDQMIQPGQALLQKPFSSADLIACTAGALHRSAPGEADAARGATPAGDGSLPTR